MDDATPKRPRPSQEERSVSVHFRLQAKQYDRVVDQAGRDGMRLADWLRAVVAAGVKRP